MDFLVHSSWSTIVICAEPSPRLWLGGSRAFRTNPHALKDQEPKRYQNKTKKCISFIFLNILAKLLKWKHLKTKRPKTQYEYTSDIFYGEAENTGDRSNFDVITISDRMPEEIPRLTRAHAGVPGALTLPPRHPTIPPGASRAMLSDLIHICPALPLSPPHPPTVHVFTWFSLSAFTECLHVHTDTLPMPRRHNDLWCCGQFFSRP